LEGVSIESGVLRFVNVAPVGERTAVLIENVADTVVDEEWAWMAKRLDCSSSCLWLFDLRASNSFMRLCDLTTLGSSKSKTNHALSASSMESGH